MTLPQPDTSHIKSPRDPMTTVEREAIRSEIRESSEALARLMAQHGDFRHEMREMFGDPRMTHPGEDAA